MFSLGHCSAYQMPAGKSVMRACNCVAHTANGMHQQLEEEDFASTARL